MTTSERPDGAAPTAAHRYEVARRTRRGWTTLCSGVPPLRANTRQFVVDLTYVTGDDRYRIDPAIAIMIDGETVETMMLNDGERRKCYQDDDSGVLGVWVRREPFRTSDDAGNPGIVPDNDD